ncbi:uncharacterized protein K452DRAFT_304979 [Aplosporella prunicola CBS 121167]|uniref:Uncharacterized protein n=1 Tax=Aplosporella prunicola CBS 121167 TaxID=1176127 RepID=A0A6A6BPC8_9PEZI|nr:uncharacterized protein K452DRAFT_304979 [Aplosporella prunicola CBS 121167]KAF2145980.1 hypothetical protein K452DRAFT_304979 [Aplosporella prunicola CBS 121167]
MPVPPALTFTHHLTISTIAPNSITKDRVAKTEESSNEKEGQKPCIHFSASPPLYGKGIESSSIHPSMHANKAKQSKAKQSKAKQSKAKQSKAKQSKANKQPTHAAQRNATQAATHLASQSVNQSISQSPNPNSRLPGLKPQTSSPPPHAPML